MRTIDWIDNDKKDVKWIVDMFNAGLLYVDDSFQRRYVWLEKHQIKLVETILLGYSIPEIYLWATHTDPTTGDTKYSIVDGQQRLGAVFNFIRGKFKLKSVHLDNKDVEYADRYFDELSDEDKRTIWRYPFSMRVIKQEVLRDNIIKMFLRLNSTDKSLNPQELRNAEFNGKFLELANEISEFEFWKEFKVFSANDLRRMQDMQFISSILVFLRFGIEAETTQESINKAYDMFNEVYDEYHKDKQMFERMIGEVSKIAYYDASNKRLVSRTTHLYTLLVVAYNALLLYDGFNEEHLRRLTEFTELYHREEELDPEKYKLLIEYRALTGEGTQRKQNRMQRVEIIKTIMGI